ncbi:hypothetical protein I5E68_07070 [Novosphingobium sp. YJ-S2-02]|uniref:Uncharacterized protein n=1 Tax=Novosphingobium aureum TaxID=2792964 RepID=A0A931HB44_9SPHN|nr:hypothetical protein [Novosphingobium aureum]MBH0112711.1 hypothetical protein [Novosphingobium aureum]
MEQPLAERMLRAFLIQMMRSEAIDPEDINAAADQLESDGDDEAAHQMRCLILDAAAPSMSEWTADRARARFHTIDGGKSDD